MAEKPEALQPPAQRLADRLQGFYASLPSDEQPILEHILRQATEHPDAILCRATEPPDTRGFSGENVAYLGITPPPPPGGGIGSAGSGVTYYYYIRKLF